MSKDKLVPSFWPDNPYPTSVFPMERDNYAEVVPDPDQRCALSGMLGREFWDIASNSIWAALQSHIEDLELAISPLEPRPQTCEWGDDIDWEDFVEQCPQCGYVDNRDGFDVLGADEGNLFCNQCHSEIKPIDVDSPKQAHDFIVEVE